MLFIEHKYSAESDQSNEATHKIDVASKILSMLQELVYIAIELSINLHDVCCRKIELNNKKYPAAICQVRTIGRVGFAFAATAIVVLFANTEDTFHLDRGQCKSTPAIPVKRESRKTTWIQNCRILPQRWEMAGHYASFKRRLQILSKRSTHSPMIEIGNVSTHQEIYSWRWLLNSANLRRYSNSKVTAASACRTRT